MGYSYDRTAAKQPDSKTLQMAVSAMKEVEGGYEAAADLQVEILRQLQGIERPLTFAYTFIQDVQEPAVRENLRTLWLKIKNSTDVADKYEAAVQLSKVLKHAQHAAEAAERDKAMWEQHRRR